MIINQSTSLYPYDSISYPNDSIRYPIVSDDSIALDVSGVKYIVW